MVNVAATAQNKVLDRLETHGGALARSENVILRSTVIHGLLSLILGAGQNDDVASHGGSELDCKMAETTDAHDGDSLVGSDAVLGQDGPDGGSGAYERSGVLRLISVGNGDNGLGVPDGAVAEGTVIGVGKAIELTFSAVLIGIFFFFFDKSVWMMKDELQIHKILTCAAVVAVTANLVCVAKTNSCADLGGDDAGANSTDNSNTLVAHNLTALQVVLVSAADTGVSGLDKDFMVLQVAGDGVGHDLALGGATEDVETESGRHGV